MSFGLNPHFTQTLDLGDMPFEHYIALAIETAKAIDWTVESVSQSGFIALTSYSFNKPRLRVEVTMREGQAIIKSETIGSKIYDWGRNKKNVENFLSVFNNVFDNTTETKMHALLADLEPAFNGQEQDLLDGSVKKPAITSFFSFFIPSKGFFVTPVIVDINILVFLLMAISGVSIIAPDNLQLIKWGASFRPSVMDGEYWRLITNIFVHVGIFHLLFNMYALLYIGVLLEPYLGITRFAAAYILSGLVASVTSIYWHDLTVSAGASGAIFGMYGVFLALLTTNFIDKTVRKSLLTSIVVFVLYNLANGMKQGIDNAAHIGGLVSGLVIGYIYYPSFNKPADSKLKNAVIGIATTFGLICAVVIYHQIPADLYKYMQQMKAFSANEESALEVFKMTNVRSEAVILDSLYNKTYTWKNNIAILDSIENLNIAPELKVNNAKLRKYCNLRLESYRLIYQKIEKKTSLYDSQIKELNSQIQNILSDLNTHR